MEKPEDPGFEENGIEVLSSTALEAQTHAEIDVAIATAHRFPRSLKRFQSDVRTMATFDQATAASCFYKLPRKNEDGSTKIIEGPSIRFAEIVGASYGNLQYGARITEIGETHVVAQGLCHDLERNVRFMAEVRRRITGRSGRRYSEDMIITTCNAACAIAARNAMFKAVPLALVASVILEAKKVAVGTGKTMKIRRLAAIEEFGKLKVTPAMLFAKLGIRGEEEITAEHLETLLGMLTAIQEGTTTVETEFGNDEQLAGPKAPESKKEEQPADAMAKQRAGWSEACLIVAKTKGYDLAGINAKLQAEFSYDLTTAPVDKWEHVLNYIDAMKKAR